MSYATVQHIAEVRAATDDVLRGHEAYHDDPHLGCHLNKEYFILPAEYKLYENASAECNNNTNGDSGSISGEFFDNYEGGSIASEDDSLVATFGSSNNSNRMREFRGVVGPQGPSRERNSTTGSGRNRRKSQRSSATEPTIMATRWNAASRGATQSNAASQRPRRSSG